MIVFIYLEDNTSYIFNVIFTHLWEVSFTLFFLFCIFLGGGVSIVFFNLFSTLKRKQDSRISKFSIKSSTVRINWHTGMLLERV